MMPEPQLLALSLAVYHVGAVLRTITGVGPFKSFFGVCLSTMFVIAAGHADEIEPEDPPYQPVKKAERPVTPAQAKAFSGLIGESACTFVPSPGMRQKSDPLIVKVQVPCGKSGQNVVTQCYGTIYCTNNVTPFYIESAACWSKDGSRCPSANACAKGFVFDSIVDSEPIEEFPVLQQSTGTAR